MVKVMYTQYQLFCPNALAMIKPASYCLSTSDLESYTNCNTENLTEFRSATCTHSRADVWRTNVGKTVDVRLAAWWINKLLICKQVCEAILIKLHTCILTEILQCAKTYQAHVSSWYCVCSLFSKFTVTNVHTFTCVSIHYKHCLTNHAANTSHVSCSIVLQ